jgi:uncharacterized membrane protein
MNRRAMPSRKRTAILPPFIAARARLYVAVAIGIAVYVALHFGILTGWLSGERLKPALAWIVVTATYLVSTIWMMRHADQSSIRARAAAIDVGLWESISIATLAGAFSLFAVAIVLEGARSLTGGERLVALAIGALTVILSWATLHVIYAVHYAHIYYDPAERKHAGKVRGGLEFPGTKEPDYWDFVYFSFVVGMTCQVSDVQITARHLRHLATAQGIVAFFYNTVVVALAVNVVAGTGG